MTTQGPWRYEAGTKTIRAVPSNYWLASMNSWDGAVDHEANANLIAAAPDLLALAEYILRPEHIALPAEQLIQVYEEMARAAIAKVKGETL